jgi:hypothetical protein
MSTFWTPEGERPIENSSPAPESGRNPTGFAPESAGSADDGQLNDQMEQLRQQLAETPASVVVANHCFGLFELAALHLSLNPPQLSEAQLAIDALAALVESLNGRLGEGETQLRDGLSQLRLAFVQIRQAAENPAEH